MTGTVFSRFRLIFKKTLRFLFMVALLILCACFLILLIFHIPIVQNAIVKNSLALVSQQLNREIRLDKFYFSMFGYCELKGLFIANKEGFGDAPLGECKALYFTFNPLSVLTGKFYLNSLHLVKPIFRLSFSQEKDSNIYFTERKIKTPKQNRGDDSAIRKIFDQYFIKKIFIEGGIFQFEYQPTHLSVDCPIINLRAALDENQTEYFCHIWASQVTTNMEARISATAELDLKGKIWGDGVHASTIKIADTNGDLWLNGKCILKNFTDPHLDFSACSFLNLRFLPVNFLFKSYMEGDIAIISKGAGLARDLSIDNRILSSGMELDRFHINRIDSSVHYHKKVFQIDDIDGNLYGGILSGEGKIYTSTEKKGMDIIGFVEDLSLEEFTVQQNWPYHLAGISQISFQSTSNEFKPSKILVDGNALIIEESNAGLQPLIGELTFTYLDKILELTDMKLFNTFTNISMPRATFESGFYRVDVNGKTEILEHLLERIRVNYPKSPHIPDLSGDADFSVQIEGKAPDYDARFDCTSTNLFLENESMGAVWAIGKTNPEFLVLSKLEIGGSFGELSGDLGFNLTKENKHFPEKGHLAFKSVELNQTSRLLGIALDVRGNASGEVFFNPNKTSASKSVLNVTNLSFSRVFCGNGSVAFIYTDDGISEMAADLSTEKGSIAFQGNFPSHNSSASWSLNAVNYDLKYLDSAQPVPLRGFASIKAELLKGASPPSAEVHITVPELKCQEEIAGYLELNGLLEFTQPSVFSWNATVNNNAFSSQGKAILDEFLHITSQIESNSFNLKPLLAASPLHSWSEIIQGSQSSMIKMDWSIKKPSSLMVFGQVTSLEALIGGYTLHLDSPSSFSIIDTQIDLDLTHFKSRDLDFSIDGNIDFDGQMEIKMDGEADLARIATLSDMISASKGKAKFDILLSGLANDPDYYGSIEIQEFYFKNPLFKVWLEDFHSEITLKEKIASVHYFDGLGGGAYTSLRGAIGIRNYLPSIIDLTLESSGIEFEYPDGFKSEADAAISLTGDIAAPLISGSIFLKETRYSKRIDYKSLIISESRAKLNLVKKNQEELPIQKPLFNPKFNLTIYAPDNMIVDNNFAKIEMKLDLQLEGSLEFPKFFGQIEAIDGKIFFQGRQFELEHATLIMANAVKLDPMIDLLGSANIESYRVSIEMNGPLLRDFFVRPYSSPPLNEIDLWSLLAIGKTQQQLSASSTDYLASGVAYVTGSIQDELEKRFKYWMGFDEFSIDPTLSTTNDSASARFTVKKFLSPNLSVTYSRSISSPGDLVRMEYQLSDNLFFVGEKKEDSSYGADLRLRWEFR